MPPVPVLPIDVSSIITDIIIGLVLLIPVTGLTARFALKPIAEAIARMRESQADREATALLERRMSLLEQEVQAITGMREDVAKLVEAQEFHLKLAAPVRSAD